MYEVAKKLIIGVKLPKYVYNFFKNKNLCIKRKIIIFLKLVNNIFSDNI
jgi:hypothetical protein